jgi:hypothetical protein
MSPHAPGVARTRRLTNAIRPSRGGGAPRAGDVLASGRSARADVHDISVVPAEPETVVARYSDAIEKVRELALRLGVDGWYTSDSTHYVRVAPYRALDEAESIRMERFRTTSEP